MNRQPGRTGLYLVLIVMLVAGYFYLNNQVATQSDYTMEALEQSAKDGKILSAKIYQNREVPTGSVAGRDSRARDRKRVICNGREGLHRRCLEGYDIAARMSRTFPRIMRFLHLCCLLFLWEH